MNFESVLVDIEKLVGLELNAVNPKTANLIITRLDHENQKFFFRLSNSEKKQSRPLSHLSKVWSELSSKRIANVEVVLEGANSSRHVHETILANLPYIEHFKYNKKKHLYRSLENTHELATIKEASASDVRKIKATLDNLKSFDRSEFSKEFQQALSLFEDSISEVKTKFPGEFKTAKLHEVQERLERLLSNLNGTFLPNEVQSDNDYINTLDIGEDTIELDSPEIIGYEGGTEPEIEGLNTNTFEELDESSQLSMARIRFTPTTVSLVYDRLLHEEIELQPDFQRKGRIWSIHHKSALIESILIGLPIPTFYFAERANGTWVIVDGLQRTTTLFDYMRDKFKLKDLKFLSELNNLHFGELPRPYQRRIREYQLHCHIISIKKDSDMMVRELFQRINTYGVKMSSQEIRCALFPGTSVKFLRFVAESRLFLEATFGKVQPKRMKDMELVLGAVSHILFGYRSFNENKFDNFLTKAMQALNEKRNLNINWKNQSIANNEYEDIEPVWVANDTDPLYNNLLERFNSALTLATEVFGQSRFKKEISGTVISKPIFELITSTFALIDDEERNLLRENRALIKEKFYGLISGKVLPYKDWKSDHYEEQNRDFIYSISQSTGKRVTIMYRFDNFIALLEDLIGRKIVVKGMLENND